MTTETLTELEQAKLENFALKHNMLQQQQQQIVAMRAAYLKQVEAAHPGYVWDEQKGLVPDEPIGMPAKSEPVLDATHPN